MSWQAVLWKEWREVVWVRGRPGKQVVAGAAAGLVMLVLFLSLFAFAAGDFDLSDVPVAAAWFPPVAGAGIVVGVASFAGMMAPMGGGTEAVAGERERHTLETLLASPASRGALFWGKMAAQMGLTLAVFTPLAAFGWLLATVLFGLRVLLVAVLMLVPALLMSLIVSGLLAVVAFAVSVRAETTKQAAQRAMLLNLPLFLIFPMLGVVLSLAFESDTPPWIFVLFGLLGLYFVGVFAGSIAYVVIRFRRAHLLAL